jgi:hypothetical protein
MQSLMYVRASGTVNKDCISSNLTSSVASVACECMDQGVLELCRGWRRFGAIRARNTIAAQRPCVHYHHGLNTHHDMLYNIRPRRNRAFFTTRSCSEARTAPRFVACWLLRGYALPALSVQLTSRRRRAAPPALVVGDAARPYHEDASLPYLSLLNCNLALPGSPIATTSTLHASEPSCATESLSLLLGSETPFYRWHT